MYSLLATFVFYCRNQKLPCITLPLLLLFPHYHSYLSYSSYSSYSSYHCYYSHACFVLSILLTAMLTIFTGSHACFVLSALLTSMHSLFASFSCSFNSLLQHLHPFLALVRQICLTFLLAWNTCSQDLHTFSLSGTTAWQCGHTLLRGMINSTKYHSNSQTPDVFTKMADYTTWWNNTAHAHLLLWACARMSQ